MSNASEAMVGKGDDPARIATSNPRIEIVTARTERGIEISVKDNGPGIASENLAKILEPLFTTKNFGTGLGLPAVEKILEQHGGGLSIASQPGQGATFTAWFPTNRRAEAA
jgi:signal transduction histidine kinase